LRLNFVVAAVALFSMTACKKTDRVKIETDEEAPRMATMLAMSDKRAPSQLLNGWYSLEDNAWRWTAGHFAVLLRPPAGSSRYGAILKLELNIPQPLLDRVKSTTLNASIKGVFLGPETYSKSGTFTYSRDVDSKLLADDSVKVEFSLDKFLPAGAAETRELGLVVTAVGFEPARTTKQ
jgi:hypothetical protein